MAKSRLGKGLGALFPELPGKEERTSARPSAPITPLVSRETIQEKRIGEAVSAMQAKVGESSRDAARKPGDAAQKKPMPKIRRASVPSLDDIAHPSDMFFSDTAALPAAAPRAAITQSEGAGASGMSLASKGMKSDGAASGIAEASSGTSSGTSDKSGKSGEDETPELKPVQGGYLAELKLDEIGPNAHQPRTIFDEDDLNELADSIKEVGVLQPIVVRRRPVSQIEAAKQEQEGHEPSDRFDGRMDSPYELIMGERRWRASQLAGLESIPAIVKTTSDTDMLRDALLENLHRVALNPLEEAAAYQQMIDEFGLTQAQLSKSVSKSRPQIANTLRLLNLPASVQKKVAAGILTAGHARALLGLRDAESMDKLADRIIAEGLSVRSTEEIVSLANLESNEPKKPKPRKNDPWAGSPIQSNLESRFDTKVSIKGTPKHGRIEIVFSSPEDMDRILELLMPNQAKGAESVELEQ